MKSTILILSIIISAAACRGPLSKPGKTEAMPETAVTGNPPVTGNTPGKVSLEKQDITIEKQEGITTIADLYKDLKNFNGKTVRIKGKVTKVNLAIMNKNWIHIQDGTEFDGQFDLTLTSVQQFEVGSVVIVEGRITLDKDFGYGYSYKVLLEDSKIVQ